MRIVQLIDSLEAGGAERMAVSYANALSNTIEFSGLITTRNEGALKEQLSQKVNYLFLKKSSNLDGKAFLKFRKFIIENKVQIIHAHSSSFFWATLLKMSYPKIKIIWHDHFGNRVNHVDKSNTVLKFCSKIFYGIITVNDELKNWASRKLKCQKVIYLPNFIPNSEVELQDKTILKGAEGKRIVFLANLKNPKNHLTILEAFDVVHEKYPDWSIHLIGKDYKDSYSKELHDYIHDLNLQNSIFTYDSCNDISAILQQSKVGVLGSTYEGFPVTLLEYGKASLIVISTNVGYCSKIINNEKNGFLFNPIDLKEIIATFEKVILGIERQDKKILKIGKQLNQTINDNFTESIIIHKYINFITNSD
jgi:glycosyltransferase involved in cell wall biosynthesis